jgi:protein O-mannosyl-transferase
MATGLMSSKKVHFAVGLLLLAAATIVVYSPALRGGFLGDDELLITNNSLVRSPDGLRQIWFTSSAVDYWPLTNTSFWLEWRVWGLNPTGYHVTNLILHLVSMLLLWAILDLLGVPGAFLAAFLFAIHPVNVESVAWIAQRKNTLSMFFSLISVWCYMKFEDVAGVRESLDRPEDPASLRPATVLRPAVSWKWYWFCLVTFTFAMFAKSSVATLPVILWVIIWWQRGRLNRRDIVLMAPMFLIAAALSALNMWCQNYGTQMVIRDATFGQRLLAAGTAVWLYVSKALLPIEQLFVYPKWEAVVSDWRCYVPFALCVGVTIVLWARRGHVWSRGILAAWLFFCAAILPALGFVDVGFMKQSLVADHYQHVALIAVVVLAAAAWSYWEGVITPGWRFAPIAVATTLCAVLMIAAWRQSRLFGDPVRLYEATLRANPDSWMVHDNLAGILYERGDVSGAIAHLEATVRLNPELATAQNRLGLALVSDGKAAEAIEHFQQAVKLNPYYANAEGNLGEALASVGRFDEAIQHYRTAAKLAPSSAEVRFSLGALLSMQNRLDEAIGVLREALKIAPGNSDARLALRSALAKAGRSAEADAVDGAIRATEQPGAPESFLNAEALAAEGKLAEAIELYRAAVGQAASYAPAHSGLAMALARIGRLDEAISEFQRAVLLAPEARSHLNLGRALAEAGRIGEAIDQVQQAIQMSPSDIEARMWLALLYAKTKQSKEAVAAAEGALAVAREKRDRDSIARIEQWLKSFQSTGVDNNSPPTNNAP